MSLFGISSGIGKTIGKGGVAVELAVQSYFFIDESLQKVMKVLPDGTVSTFHDYSAGAELVNGLICNSRDQILYVMIGRSATIRKIDKFTDPQSATSSGPTTIATGIVSDGGQGFYEYGSNRLFWGTKSGVAANDDGAIRIDDDGTDLVVLSSATDYDDAMYWPPDSLIFWVETTSADSIFTSTLAGGSFTDRGAVTGSLRALGIPPAHAMGESEYLIISDSTGLNLRRRARLTAAGEIVWLDLSATSAIKLRPYDLRINYVDETVVFTAAANGGSGTDGLYSIPLKESAQSEANLTKIADITTFFSGMTAAFSRSGFDIMYNTDVSPLYVDVADPLGNPDLVVENVTFDPASADTEETFTISFRIRNIGDRKAVASTARMQLSLDTTIDGSDVSLNPLDESIPVINKGEFHDVVDLDTVAPDLTPEANYYVGITADINSDVTDESDTDNNIGVSASQIAINTPTGPSGPLTTNLVEWWGLQEVSGNRVGEWAGHILADNATVLQTTGHVGAKAAIFVAANSEFLSLANASAGAFQMGTSDMTILCWIKPTLASSSGQPFWYALGSTDSQDGISCGVNGAASKANSRIQGSQFKQANDNLAADLGTTWHLAITEFDRSGVIKTWFDNVEDPTTNESLRDISAMVSEDIQTTRDLRVGQWDNFSTFTDASFEQLVVYKRLLTPAEKTQFWNSGAGMQFSDLV